MRIPDVYIITPNYHGEKYIGEAIQSVIDQTHKSWSLLLVDDSNGEDGIEKYADPSKNISVVRMNDVGQSACKTHGAQITHSKYILFLDADDKIHPQFLEKTIKCLEENPNISFAYTDTQHFDGANSYWEQAEYSFYNLLINNYICNCSLIRREHFEGFDLNNFGYWEDYENWIAMGAKGYYGKHIPEKLYYYRIHKESGMQSKRNSVLSPLFKAYIISKFPLLYPQQWVDEANRIISQYPKDIMKWKPFEQEKYLKSKGLI